MEQFSELISRADEIGKQGCNLPEAFRKRGENVLHYASTLGSVTMVETLIQKGAGKHKTG